MRQTPNNRESLKSSSAGRKNKSQAHLVLRKDTERVQDKFTQGSLRLDPGCSSLHKVHHALAAEVHVPSVTRPVPKNYIKPLDLSLSNTTRYVLLNAATEALEKATSQRRRATATTPRPQNSAASQQRSNAASQHRSPDSCVRARSGRSVW